MMRESLLDEIYTGEIWAEPWGGKGASHENRCEQSISGRRNGESKSPEAAAITRWKILVALVWFLEYRIVLVRFLRASIETRLDSDNIRAHIIDGKAREQGSKNRQEPRKASWIQETESRWDPWQVRTSVLGYHRHQTPNASISEDNLSLPLHLYIIPWRFRVTESRSWDAHILVAWKR